MIGELEQLFEFATPRRRETDQQPADDTRAEAGKEMKGTQRGDDRLGYQS